MDDPHVRLKSVPDIAYIDIDTGKLISSSVHWHTYDTKDRSTVPALKEVKVDFKDGKLLDGCTGKVVAILWKPSPSFSLGPNGRNIEIPAPESGGLKPEDAVDPNDRMPFPFLAVPPVIPVNSQ